MSAGYYRYQAYDAQGNVQTGQINAESEREALKILQGKKLIPVKITRSEQDEGERSRGRKVKGVHLLDFTTGLCTLIEARVPLDKALRLLEGITEAPAMRQLVITLRRGRC